MFSLTLSLALVFFFFFFFFSVLIRIVFILHASLPLGVGGRGPLFFRNGQIRGLSPS